MNKSSGPNSILYKILNLKKKKIFQNNFLFNLSLSSDVFPSFLKLAKAVPVYKKDSKLDCHNYSPISLLLILKKYLKN